MGNSPGHKSVHYHLGEGKALNASATPCQSYEFNCWYRKPSTKPVQYGEYKIFAKAEEAAVPLVE